MSNLAAFPRMKLPLLASLVPVLVFGSPLRVAAQGNQGSAEAVAAAQIEVASVKFGYSRAENGGDNWMEALIELDVKPNGKQVSGEFLNRVRVTLNLGCEATSTKGEKSLTYYKSSVEMVSVEGGKAFVRFYLPHEVVKRDRLRGDPQYYLVELEAGGEPQKPNLQSVSKSINNSTLLAGFKGKVASESGANDSLLMPQYLTPFANDSRRSSPTFLRRDAQR